MKKSLERAIADGSIERATRGYSAYFMLMSVAIENLEQAEAALKKHNLYMREIKMYHNQIERAFDKLVIEYKSITLQGKEDVFAEEYEKIAKKINAILNE